MQYETIIDGKIISSGEIVVNVTYLKQTETCIKLIYTN